MNRIGSEQATVALLVQVTGVALKRISGYATAHLSGVVAMVARRVALLLVALLPCTAVCQEIPWQAERVMLRRDGVRAGKPVAGHLVRQGKELSAEREYTVIRAAGGHLELGDNLGWVTRADVVRMADAAAFYTARIKEEPTAAKWYGRRALAGVAEMAVRPRLDLSVATQPNAVSSAPQHVLDDLMSAVRLDANDRIWRQSLGMAYLSRGEWEKARDQCEALLRSAPLYPEGYLLRAAVRLAQGDPDGATADSERSAELESKCINSQASLAFIYVATGNKMRANEVFRRMADTEVSTSSEYYLRASARTANGDTQGSLADLTEVLRLDPANIEVRRLRGCLLRRQGDYLAALAEFGRASRQQLGDPITKRMEAFLLATCKDAAIRDGRSALQLAREAVKLAGAKLDCGDLDTLAAAYAEVGDFPAAVNAQKQAIRALEKEKSYYDELLVFQWWLGQFEREQPRRE